MDGGKMSAGERPTVDVPVRETFGIDWIRWAISVAGAAILSFAYTALTRKKSET